MEHECDFAESVSDLGHCEQVQETCRICGTGRGYLRPKERPILDEQVSEESNG